MKLLEIRKKNIFVTNKYRLQVSSDFWIKSDMNDLNDMKDQKEIQALSEIKIIQASKEKLSIRFFFFLTYFTHLRKINETSNGETKPFTTSFHFNVFNINKALNYCTIS